MRLCATTGRQGSGWGMSVVSAALLDTERGKMQLPLSLTYLVCTAPPTRHSRFVESSRAVTT